MERKIGEAVMAGATYQDTRHTMDQHNSMDQEMMTMMSSMSTDQKKRAVEMVRQMVGTK
jgi:hypothetical protein